MTIWTLHAAYDPEAHVWYTLDCDVPGLVTEGETLERLRERAAAVMPELIADNAAHINPERRTGPHSLRLVAFHESTMPVAAWWAVVTTVTWNASLVANGCTFVRHGKGDHEIWFSPITQINFTVDTGTKKRLTANASLKQAGIKPSL